MAFKVIRQTEDGVPIYECLSTDTKKTNVPTGAKATETDTGDEYEYKGSTAGWKRTKSRGSLNVSSRFRPSSYTGKITSTEDGTTFAIASGATSLLLQSLEVTGLEEYAILAFGTSAADAQTNLAKSGTTPNIIATAGVVIRSGDSTAGGVAPDQFIGIPVNATHAAIGNGVAATAQVVMVTQGNDG